MLCLRRPQRIELRLDHRARWVDLPFRLVALARAGPEAHRLHRAHRPVGGAARGTALAESRVQIFAERALPGLLGIEPRHQLGRPGLHPLRFRGLLLPVGPAVAFEAAALVQMKDRAAQFVKGQRAVQPFRAKPPGVRGFEAFSLGRIGGHQTVPDQQSHQVGSAVEKAVSPAAGGTRLAPLLRQRGSGLRVAPIRKNPRAHAADANRVHSALLDRACRDR